MSMARRIAFVDAGAVCLARRSRTITAWRCTTARPAELDRHERVAARRVVRDADFAGDYQGVVPAVAWCRPH